MNNSLLLTPKWSVPSHIKAYTTLRSPGYSEGPYAGFNLGLHVGDNESDVRANREILRQKANLPSEPKWTNQVHSNIAVLAETISDTPPVTADASYTKKTNTICVVLTADCLPILVTNTEGSEVAAIHAGWRGLANGIVENTLATLASSPETLMVWVGPSISQPYYEVGEDFYATFSKFHTKEECHQAFKQKPNKETPKWLADVPLLAYQRLVKIGVQPQHIYLSNECTYAHEDRYFSYRRDGVTGRMASMIFIDS
jgi:YfiH family protein